MRHGLTLLTIGTSALLVGGHLLVAPEIAVQISALVLCVIAGAYIGFAVADGRPRVIATEGLVAAAFGGAGLIALNGMPLFIPLALFLHGLWDLAHHQGHIGAHVPRWYIPFCVIVDWSLAIALTALFLR